MLAKSPACRSLICNRPALLLPFSRKMCPPLTELTDRYLAAGGRYLICPICFNARKLDETTTVKNATLGGTVPMWQWIGDEPAVTFSF